MDVIQQSPGEPVAPTAEEYATALATAPAPSASDASPQVAPTPPAVATAVRWLTERKMDTTYDLEFPFELDGVEHRVITIRRPTGGQIAATIDRLRCEPEKPLHWPMFYVGTAPLSEAAWDAMIDDDHFALTEIAADFLPARFKSPRAPVEPAES